MIRKPIKEVCTFLPKSKIRAGEGKEIGQYPFFTSSDVQKLYLDDYLHDGERIIIGTGGKPSCNYCSGKFAVSTDNFVLQTKSTLFAKYLYYFLRHNNLSILEKGFRGAGLKHIGKEYLESIMVPVKDLSEQRSVVATLDKINDLIDANKRQLELLDEAVKSRFVEMFGDPMHKSDKFIYSTYGDKFQLNAGGTPSKSNPEYWNGGTISWIGSNLCQNVVLNSNDGKFITEEGYKNSSARLFPVDTVLIALVGATIGKTALLKFETTTNQNVLGVRGIEEAGYNPYFVYMYTQGLYHKFIDIGDGGFNMASKAFISELYIPEVNINLQNQYADFFKQVDKLKFDLQKHNELLAELLNKKMDEYFGGDM